MQAAEDTTHLLTTSTQSKCFWPRFPHKNPIKVLVLQRKLKPGALLLYMSMMGIADDGCGGKEEHLKSLRTALSTDPQNLHPV